MKVHIPFYERFRKPMLDDVKTWTSRTRQYGKVGDTFDAFNHEFELVAVFKAPLEFVADHWDKEGCSSRQDFREVWKKIHPRKGYIIDWQVFVHIFRRIN